MVTLILWKKIPGSPGHAAMHIAEQYVSLWPTREGNPIKNRIVNKKGNRKDFLGMTHKPKLTKRYTTDTVIMGREASIRIHLNSMNEERMLEYWKYFKRSPRRFNVKNANCSTLISLLLEVGSGVHYKKKPCINIKDYIDNRLVQLVFQLRFMGNEIEMWSPDEIHLYAYQIKSMKLET